MIYNFTKCESVLAKIMADLDSSEMNQRTTDIKEWIFEAIDRIGAPMQFVQKESGVDGVPIYQISDFQIPLPVDLNSIDGVAYSDTPTGPWVPMSKKTGVFKEPKHRPSPGPGMPYDSRNKVVDEIAEDMVMHNHHHPEMVVEKVPTTQAELISNTAKGVTKYWDASVKRGLYKKPEYFIKPGWLVANKRHGFIKLAYKAIPTDERGYPLIPDLASYQDAIYWYVVMKLNFPKFLKGKLGGKGVNNNANTYQYIQQQWHFYRNQAYAEAMMPTADDMRNIKNDWNKLLPDYEADKVFFDNIGDEQIIYNDYYYGY